MARTGRSFYPATRLGIQRQVLAVPSAVVTTKFLEPGTSATYDFSLFDGGTGTTNGSVTSDTSNTNGQPRAFKSTGNTGGATRIAYAGKLGIFGANSRVSFGLTFSALGSSFDATSLAAQNKILQVTAAGNSFALCLDASGVLHLIDDSANANRATGATTLAINTRYRISVAWTITSTTVNSFKVWVAIGDAAPVLDINVTNITIGAAAVTDAYFGITRWDCTSTAVSLWYTDIYVDNSSALTDPGNIQVTAKRPNGNGSVNEFTTQVGSGGSGYGTGHSPQVNERALSETNGWSVIGVGVAKTETYACENASTGDVAIGGRPIVGAMGWVRAKSLTSETGGMYLFNTLPGAIALTSTPTTFLAFLAPGDNPDFATNAIGIFSDTTATTVSLYECGIVVAYLVAPILSTPGTLALTLTGLAPSPNLGVVPPTTALVITAFTPQVNLVITPPVTALVITKYAPDVSSGITPGTLALVITTFAPQVNLVVSPPLLALTIILLAPQVQLGVVPGTLALVLATFAPQANLVIIPGVLALIITTFAPETQTVISPPTLALILTTFAPQLKLVITPPVLALVLATFIPTVGLSVSPGLLALTLTLFAPLLGLGVIPSKLSLILTFYAPEALTPSSTGTTDFQFEGGVRLFSRPPTGSAMFRK